jgi:hypothetical protein
MRTKSLILALAASSALALAPATPALAIHNGWDTTVDQHQGGSTNDCNTDNGCTTIETKLPKGQNTDPPKEGNNSPKEPTCLPSSPPGQCK